MTENFTLNKKNNLKDKKIYSNKSFGLIFFIFFLILSLYFYFFKSKLNLYLIVISIIFLILGVLNSSILNPFKKLWIKFGELLGKFVSPIIMFLIYFFIVFPTNLVLKILSKDILELNINKKENTYWKIKEKINNSMDNQF